MRDYYEVLGVSKTATDDEIKKAYRTLAKKYHPDMHPGDKECEEKFKEVNEAYKTVTTIAVEKFLDINADAHVNYADVLAMWKMISGEAEVEYNVVADVDKNGIVEAKDFMDLYSFVLGELDYEDMVAIVAEEEVAA